MPCLFIAVSIHLGRFHGLDTEGRAEWPPSPGRLFQALVAAAAKGAMLDEADREALDWLQKQSPQRIAAPATWHGQSFNHFMPNNDLDTKGGDPRRIGEIRSATKRYRPRIFDAQLPIFYASSFEGDDIQAKRICAIAERVYQLGRGVDMAWATAEVIADDEAEKRLAEYPGAVYRPSSNGEGVRLPCPDSGSLESLIERFKANQQRFKNRLVPAPIIKEPSRMKVEGRTFAQAPKPRFHPVVYDCSPVRLHYELQAGTPDARFHPLPLRDITTFVKHVRDDCAERLEKSLEQGSPGKAGDVKRVFGLCRETTEADKAVRIRIIPMPSIGHQHADRGIRRLLVEVPPNCPLPARDIDWAFAGFNQSEASTGEIDWMLTRADGHGMLEHYGIGEDNTTGFRIWRTVTPAVLPVEQSHGRSTGRQRADTEATAAFAVEQALRHAGVNQKPVAIRVQREPFDSKGTLAQDFAADTRFDARRLWHVEVTFSRSLHGPLLVGNGRYLGLGLMRPVKQIEGGLAFHIMDGLSTSADATTLTRALRRAVMARVQGNFGKRSELPVFFTGHERNGKPARRGQRSHLAYVFDAPHQRLLVLAPHILEHRNPGPEEREHINTMVAALTDLKELRAGSAGKLSLIAEMVDSETDPVLTSSETWITQTSYRPTRHPKHDSLEQAIANDVMQELERRHRPRPSSVQVTSVSKGARGGLYASIRLTFSVGVKGPILLGQTSNFGGGLFVPQASAN